MNKISEKLTHYLLPLPGFLSRPFLHPRNALLRGILILVLGLTIIPASPLYATGSFTGVYMGTFSGNFDNGEFAMLVRPDDSAIVVFFDGFDETGGVVNLTIDNDGSFSYVDSSPPFDTVTGQISGNDINATICCAEPGTLAGTRSPDSGPFEDAGGLYIGALIGTGVSDGTALTFDGQIYFIVDAPGSMMVLARVDIFVGGVFEEDGETGGMVSAAANGTINGTLLDGVTLNGSINMGNFTAVGSWSFSEPGESDSGTWNASRIEALPVSSEQTDIDVTGVSDISGDSVADIAELRASGQPKVRYFSGASRDAIKTVDYLGDTWSGVAAATVVDGNSNGVANDPAVAVLAHKASAGKHAVEVRRADNGALINKIFFLSASWEIIDVAVLDDKNGDGVTGDTAIAVLGVNPNKPFDEQIKVQVRRLRDGKQLANWFFLNGNWTPLALEAVNRIGRTPLLAVLANKAATGANVVQARKFSNGSVQRDTSFFNASWVARDVSILTDSDGNGNANDPAYLVLANHLETGRNKVQARRASDGARLKNITMLGTNWDGKRVTGTGDISGNLREEVGVLAEKRTDGTVAIQLKDYEDRTTTATIFP